MNIGKEFREMVTKKLPDEKGRVIGIVSGKGGVGKTSVSSLLSYAIAAQGLATLVIDMDTGLRNLDIVMGVDNQVVRNLFDVIERGEDFKNAAIRAKTGIDTEGNPIEGENLPWICLSDQLKIKNAIAKKNFQALLVELREVFDIIILDAPAGIEYGCRLVTESADEAFIVCTPEMPSLRSVDQLSNIFDNRIPVSLIVNRIIPELIANGGGMTLEDIQLFTVLPIALAIPFDPGIIAYGHTGRSVWHVLEAPSRKAVAEFAENFFGSKEEEIPEVIEDATETDINPEVLVESIEQLRALDKPETILTENPYEPKKVDKISDPENIKTEEKPKKRNFFSWLFKKNEKPKITKGTENIVD